MITSTRSAAWPPICRPTLPPVSVMNVGADQPPSVRALRMPRPRMPPKMKPAFRVPGKMAMPSAFVDRFGNGCVGGRHHLVEDGNRLTNAAGLLGVRSFLRLSRKRQRQDNER